MKSRKQIFISNSQVIYYRFPDAFYNLPNSVVRVTSIKNDFEEAPRKITKHVLGRIAERMTTDLYVRHIHNEELLKRKEARQQQNDIDHSAINDNLELDNSLAGFFGDDDLYDSKVEELSADLSPISVRPDSLEFILVDSSANVRTKIFPRSFHCSNCGHFLGIDPKEPPTTLTCPCCKEATLRQESIIMGCARCGSVAELSPPGELIKESELRKTTRFEEILGGSINCPDCQKGHIHLHKHSTNLVQKWQWVCTECSFCQDVRSFCLECMLPKTDDIRSDVVPMRPFPATATGALLPLIDIQTFVGDEPIVPNNLLKIARQNQEEWADYFEMATETDIEFLNNVSILTSASIKNAFLLRKVRVVTSIYGYRAGKIMQNSRFPIPEDKQFARFFRDPLQMAEYLCYGMITEGSALVIEFDQDEVFSRLANFYSDSRSFQNYADASEFEINRISSSTIQELVRTDDYKFNLVLFPALHALEHAVLTMASRLLGHDSLGSMLFFKAGMILLYERDEVGRGGVVQLVNRGKGLLELIQATIDQTMGCAQGCNDSCPSCTYVQDVFCHYRLEELNKTWLPPNALLSRNGARTILNTSY